MELKRYDMGEGITAFSTMRHGGHSTGNYAEFNINHYCGDDEENIRRNRELLCSELHIDASRLIIPHQTHSTEVRQIAGELLALPQSVRDMVLEGVDAVMTSEKGLCIGVSTADCIPILLHDKQSGAIAAVHAGWRGTVKRIVCKTIAAMGLAYGTRGADLQAVIGPGISLEAFEVGDEVYEAFAKEAFPMDKISRRYEKWHIDLWECNRLQLVGCGVPEDNIHVSGICTYNNADDFFSARRLGINSGRIFTGILAPPTSSPSNLP